MLLLYVLGKLIEAQYHQISRESFMMISPDQQEHTGLSYKWSQTQRDELQQDVYATFSCHIGLMEAQLSF